MDLGEAWRLSRFPYRELAYTPVGRAGFSLKKGRDAKEDVRTVNKILFAASVNKVFRHLHHGRIGLPVPSVQTGLRIDLHRLGRLPEHDALPGISRAVSDPDTPLLRECWVVRAPQLPPNEPTRALDRGSLLLSEDRGFLARTRHLHPGGAGGLLYQFS